MKKFLRRWGPVLFYSLLILFLSSRPVLVPQGSDKLLHILEYAVMGFFVTRGILLTWDWSRLWGGVFGFLGSSVLGGLDELFQSFIPYRQASYWDFGADVLGSALGALLFIYLGALLYKSNRLYTNPHQKCC